MLSGFAVPPACCSVLQCLICHFHDVSGAYTAERIKELQASTKQLPTAKAPAGKASEAVFKLSGSFKSATPPKDDHFDTGVIMVMPS